MPATPVLDAHAYAPVARTEYDRFAELIGALTPAEWTLGTDCDRWSVRLVVAHVVGATEANASPAEMIRQLRHGRRGIAVEVDAVNELQVGRRSAVPPTELVARFRAAAPAAVRLRARLARRFGRVPLRVGAPINETWRLAYLAGVIYTRDTWMHRIDISRATGRSPVLTCDHDGVIVADVVRDWGRRHGRPVELELTGPAGGTFRLGRGGERLTLDAVDFCRRASGRGVPPWDTFVPF